MTGKELAQKAIDIAKNYKTLYVMGCFGAPMTAANKTRYCNNHSYNLESSRTKMIKAASADTFGFDCVCLIKGILWGWSGNGSKVYGGASYGTNGVPDIGADAMIKRCKDVSTDFSKIEVGEAVWMTGHIGIYIGDGLCVESSPKWDNGVQITAVANIGQKAGYNARRWTKHGKLPYVEYVGAEEESKPTTITTTTPAKKPAVKIVVEPAKSFAKLYDKEWTVTAAAGLRLRRGAGTTKGIIRTMKYGEKVRCYGYYTKNGATIWLYVKTPDGTIGYCSKKYLK